MNLNYKCECEIVKDHPDYWYKDIIIRCSTCSHNLRHNKEVFDKRTKMCVYVSQERAKWDDVIEKKMEAIEFQRAPIKYYYDNVNFGRAGFKNIDVFTRERFKLHKTGTRYYCCKNRVDYYINRPPEDHFIRAGLEEELCEMKGWTEADFEVLPMNYIGRTRDYDKCAMR